MPKQPDDLLRATMALRDVAAGYPEKEIDEAGLRPLLKRLAIHLSAIGGIEEEDFTQIQKLFGPDESWPQFTEEQIREGKKRLAQKAIVDAGLTYEECIRALGAKKTEKGYGNAARQIYGKDSSDKIEIDDLAMVLPSGDAGAWVSAWLYVNDSDLSQDDLAIEKPWVVYHPENPVSEQFWNNEDGWTNLSGATRFEQPITEDRLPLGGNNLTRAQNLEIGSMKDYAVLLTEKEDGPMGEAFLFSCFADDEQHAVEQAENAYPACEVQQVSLAEELEYFDFLSPKNF